MMGGLFVELMEEHAVPVLGRYYSLIVMASSVVTDLVAAGCITVQLFLSFECI